VVAGGAGGVDVSSAGLKITAIAGGSSVVVVGGGGGASVVPSGPSVVVTVSPLE